MEYRRPYLISEQVSTSHFNSQRELIILSQHVDVALPMNLDEADIVDTPNLIGRPVEEPTEYRENNYTFMILLPDWPVSIPFVFFSVLEA